MSIYRKIDRLIEYAIARNLISANDEIWARNQMISALNLYTYEEENENTKTENELISKETIIPLAALLEDITDYAVENGLIEDSITERDIFDTKIMGIFTDRPSNVTARFFDIYKRSKKKATEWFYSFSKDTNYIRTDRIVKDRRFEVDSKYGTIEISINLSKPEKDPKAIAAALKSKDVTYPKCQLCIENEGYEGRLDHPARANHRIIPIEINGEDWGFQYSPYVYYNEHCIVFNSKHVPMKIEENTFRKMFSFIDQFPHYFIGSNADLPIVGGSILSHDHFQGGKHTFPMEKAEAIASYTVKGYEDVSVSILNWPLSVIRLSSEDKERVISLATHILNKWRGFSDEEAFIFAETDGEKHNTITPIGRFRDKKYELDLVLRNNITTKDRPMGLYHPREEYHHIKKENIGLIEVMGLAVLPARLDKEMNALGDILSSDTAADEKMNRILGNEALNKHADWAKVILEKYEEIVADNVDEILETEIGEVFVHVLEDAGVYKSKDAFERFINSL